MKRYFVYILASKRNGTLYIGVTNDLVRRVFEHREGTGSDFTSRYAVKRLVHFEEATDIRAAIQREKTLKHWPREWKVALIEQTNPDWNDFYDRICS